MIEISKFFEKFIKLNQNSEIVRNKILEAIKEITHITLTLSDIQFKDGILSLSCSPAIRGEIMMNKERIIADLIPLGIKIKSIK